MSVGGPGTSVRRNPRQPSSADNPFAKMGIAYDEISTRRLATFDGTMRFVAKAEAINSATAPSAQQH